MKPGRPTKFNQDRANGIIEGVGSLVPLKFVAEANGITRTTLYDWINKGFEDIQSGKTNTALAQFSNTIKKCQYKIIAGLLADIRSGVKGWQALAWILERLYYEYFGAGSQEFVQLKQELENIKKALKDG